MTSLMNVSFMKRLAAAPERELNVIMAPDPDGCFSFTFFAN